MKTITVCVLLCGLVVSSSSPAALAGVVDEAPKTNPSGTYVLFMGADLDVSRENKFHRVEDVVGSEFKIKLGKKDFFVRTRNRSTDLKVSHSLKLSGASVILAELESGPTYTSANDPARKFIAASGSAGGAAAIVDLAQGQVNQAAFAESNAARVAEAYPDIEAAQIAAADAKIHLADTERTASNLGHMANYDSQNSAAAHADRMQGELTEGNYDAMEVAFRVSSPVELDDPHMIVLFRFQPPGGKPGDEGMLIHAKALDPIGSKPKYVRVREGGLPRGFKFLNCTVHIYNRGQEVATNVSPKRVELTRDEARQYMLVEHLGANKGATVPAVPVPGTLPHSRRQTLSADQLNRTLFAKVGPDGSVLGVFIDPGCDHRLEDLAPLAAIGEVFFKPALEKGKPRESVARFTLGGI